MMSFIMPVLTGLLMGGFVYLIAAIAGIDTGPVILAMLVGYIIGSYT